MKMRTAEEIKLKALFTADEILQVEIKKRKKKMVLLKTLYIVRSNNSYRNTLEALKNFLDENKSLWLEITFCYNNPLSKCLVYSDIKPKVFLLGRRDVIEEHIQEITVRILAGKRWIGKRVGISPLQELDIRDFI